MAKEVHEFGTRISGLPNLPACCIGRLPKLLTLSTQAQVHAAPLAKVSLHSMSAGEVAALLLGGAPNPPG